MSSKFWGQGGCREARQAEKGVRQAASLLLFTPLLLLTGCGNDRPHSGPPPGRPRQVSAAPAETPPTAAPAEQGTGGPTDPQVGDAKPEAPDPFLGHDPLMGRAMPTAHSHWLRGRLHGARVTVLLNGVRRGEYSGVIDKDITMSLQGGANTVTFVYQPTATGAAADLEVVEGEHHPPIAPLVTFRSKSDPAAIRATAGGDALTPVTRTFPFVAN